jgi:hypothetical protein
MCSELSTTYLVHNDARDRFSRIKGTGTGGADAEQYLLLSPSIGSVVALTDGSGNLVASYQLDPISALPPAAVQP